MPNGWMILMSWQVIMEIYNAPVIRELISYHYRLQKEAGSLRYSLYLRTNHVRLVDGLSKSDKGWKDKYFVIKGEYTLENILTEWKAAGWHLIAFSSYSFACILGSVCLFLM